MGVSISGRRISLDKYGTETWVLGVPSEGQWWFIPPIRESRPNDTMAILLDDSPELKPLPTEHNTEYQLRGAYPSWLSGELSITVQRRHEMVQFREKIADLFGRIPEVVLVYIESERANDYHITTLLTTTDKGVRFNLFDMEMAIYKMYPDYGIDFHVHFSCDNGGSLAIPGGAQICLNRINA